MQINGPSNTDIAQVLNQMRAIRDQGRALSSVQHPGVVDAPGRPTEVPQANFGAALKGAIDSVNALQQASSKSSTDFLSGKEDDLIKVMVNSQKSRMGFQAMVQVRNRFVSAYQDIMNMPI